MRAIDTNVLVRLLTRDDRLQVAAAERFVERGAWVSHLVVAETMGVLDTVYQRPAKDIAVAIKQLLSHESLVLQEPDVVADALALFQSRLSVGFSDCLMLSIARKAGHVPFGTF